ncbi:glycosyltransferase family 4 protein [Saccharicrinis aurantiacus]|uniref:glycosyltransferase family 4 protein n=1 Tax=Saccharicrinis aurantiacus TaxID=1849719 RepID=UPI0024920A81|nr:glycosyltransferase family 4 protein [Saccharicrinis aurantiacus]
MKVAIIQEWLTSVGGSDKVVKALSDIFPNAKIYTLVSDPKVCDELGIDNNKVTTSFIQKLPFAKKKYRVYLPFFSYAIEQFNLDEYDVIISSSHAVAKGVLTNSNQLHICYCHSPMRYAWDLHHQYLKDAGLSKGLKSFIARYTLHRLRIWDLASSFRVDHFISNSKYIAKRINKVYKRTATTIYPNVDITSFSLHEEKEDYYLASSRLVPYKRMDIIVEAFNKMPEKKLVVIGDGPEFKKIQAKANANIQMLGYVDFNTLKSYMQRAKAFVFAANEDFGIIPVEAQACGTPVIAYGVGGSLETVKEGVSGYFFKEQTADSITECIKNNDSLVGSLNKNAIRKHAENFSEQIFKDKVLSFVTQKYKEFNER